MRSHEELLELATSYALDALEKQERDELSSHLATGCEACLDAVRQARIVSDHLVFALEPVAPDARVRKRLLARARGHAKPKTGSWLVWAAAAGWVAALGGGVYIHQTRHTLELERTALSRARSELGQARDAVDLVSAPATHSVSLAGQESAPGASAKAFVDARRGRLLLYVYDLPRAAPDTTYQLWIIVDGAPVSVGIFNVATDGSATFDADPLAAFTGDVTVAVTVEPAGGVPQPTGPMVLLGS